MDSINQKRLMADVRHIAQRLIFAGISGHSDGRQI
jgi:hypothetical protein